MGSLARRLCPISVAGFVRSRDGNGTGINMEAYGIRVSFPTVGLFDSFEGPGKLHIFGHFRSAARLKNFFFFSSPLISPPRKFLLRFNAFPCTSLRFPRDKEKEWGVTFISCKTMKRRKKPTKYEKWSFRFAFAQSREEGTVGAREYKYVKYNAKVSPAS